MDCCIERSYCLQGFGTSRGQKGRTPLGLHKTTFGMFRGGIKGGVRGDKDGLIQKNKRVQG